MADLKTHTEEMHQDSSVLIKFCLKARGDPNEAEKSPSEKMRCLSGNEAEKAIDSRRQYA